MPHTRLTTHLFLRRLLPLHIDTDQGAQRTGKTNKAVIETNPVERRQRDRQVAQVRSQLQPAGRALPTTPR